jgi:hypothetical protein
MFTHYHASNIISRNRLSCIKKIIIAKCRYAGYKLMNEIVYWKDICKLKGKEHMRLYYKNIDYGNSDKNYMTT